MNILKRTIKPVYRGVHDFLFYTSAINPVFRKKFNGKPVLRGHISQVHIDTPSLDEELTEQLKENHIAVSSFFIDKQDYLRYLNSAGYPAYYFGGGKDTAKNYTEKTLEHYVSTCFMDLSEESVFVDIAACNSPFYQVVKKIFGVRSAYQQDLVYAGGLHGDRIGGFAHEISLEDNSIDAVTLHCSLEHFEGISDTLFFQAMEKKLKPGGKVIVLPFYIASEYTIHVDPAFNLLRRHTPDLNDNRARLRYCNWYQFFSRHYDIRALKERILEKAPMLHLEIFKVENYKDIDSRCYLRFIAVFTKTS